MTSVVWALLVLFGLASAGHWVVLVTGRADLVLPTRVAATAVMVAVALAIDTPAGGVRAWFVGGLLLALVADVLAALPGDRSVEALGAAVAAQFAFAFGLSLVYQDRIAVIVGAVVAVVLVRDVFRDVLLRVRLRAPALVWAVAVHVGAVAATTALAIGAVAPLVIAGSILFAASVSLGDRARFGRQPPPRWLPVSATVVYHLALVGLTTGLLHLERFTVAA